MVEEDLKLVADLPEAAAAGSAGSSAWSIRKFHSSPSVRAVRLMLLEPMKAAPQSLAPSVAAHADVRLEVEALVRRLEQPHVGAALGEQQESAQGLPGR